MNKRRRYRAVLLLGTVCLLIVVVSGLRLQAEQRQEALNRQLIAALVKNDPQQALLLVERGADPNTPIKPSPPLSLGQLWDWLIHRTTLPRNDAPSAFLLACGGCWPEGTSTFREMDADDPHLVETMLQHGAQKNGKDANGLTPLIWGVGSMHPKTVGVLLHAGADVNAQDRQGMSALHWSAMFTADHSPKIEIARQLLAQGANPNLTDLRGRTPLHLAQQSAGLRIRALLRQAGAKK